MLQYASWAMWIHDIEAVPSSLYQKVRFSHEGAIVTIYGNTLTVPKQIFAIDYEQEPLTLDGFEIEGPGFERREEEVEKILIDFAPYSNNIVVAIMRKVNYFRGMNLGRIMKKPTNDDLLEIKVRKMARVKAKAKGLPCPPEPLKPYTSTLNGKFVKARDSQHF